MDTKFYLTDDEREDIRFALGKLADQNEARADAVRGACSVDIEVCRRPYLEQAERFRALARKVSEGK